jgi:uncharacterized membrane protein
MIDARARRGPVQALVYSNGMPPYSSAFLIGVVAGLRSMTAPAVVSWGARVGPIDLRNTPLAFLGSRRAPYIASALAVAELVVDKLPRTPSRKMPLPFAARIIIGALCGAAVTARNQSLIGGLASGALGGVAGTLGGYSFRTKSAQAIGGRDYPIAVLEDAMAIGGGVGIVGLCRRETGHIPKPLGNAP